MTKRFWNWDTFFDTSFITVVGIGGIMGTFHFGKWWGGGEVLESARLNAQNEIQYQLVTVQDTAPSQEMMEAATTICQQEQSSSIDDCMKDFLNGYGNVWVVNLVDGSRTLLSVEKVPVAPITATPESATP
jgi:hypothetical protein